MALPSRILLVSLPWQEEPMSVRLNGTLNMQAVSVVGIDSMVEGKGRRAAARTFFDLLALRTTGYVDLEQKVPYGDILISPMSKLLN